jgi:hypothetical protein
MEYSVYRKDTEGQKNVSGAINIVAVEAGLPGGAFAGELKQTFKYGLCALLTINDIGPVECRQPECNERNCPDISHLLIDTA